MAKNTYRDTGFYAVVSFGQNGTWTIPWFLKKNPKTRYRKDEELLACHQFTGDLGEAATFLSYEAAEKTADKVRMLFRKNGHILAKGINVVQLFCKDAKKGAK